MKEFVEFIARHLVDHPDAVILDVEEKDEKLVFKLKVSETDVGKIIGKSGRTASALRTLLRAVAAKEGKRAVLDIIG
ncbi:MAG: KH domain-containing protein [Ignavibacteriales bacterium]|nr:KH domain-containing protein [Ignavibacteriales bacterium]